MTTYKNASINDLEQVAHLMATGFLDYPFMTHSFFKRNFETQVEKQAFLAKMCFVYAKAMLPNVTIFVSKNGEEFTGVAIFSKIEKMKISVLDLIRGGLIAFLPQLCKKHAFSFIKTFLREGAVLDKKYMTTYAWYLHIFVTNPKHRGMQIGTKLMVEMLRFIKENQGESLVTSTNTEMALKFYQKNGFELMEQEQLTFHEVGKIDKFIIRRDLQEVATK